MVIVSRTEQGIPALEPSDSVDVLPRSHVLHTSRRASGARARLSAAQLLIRGGYANTITFAVSCYGSDVVCCPADVVRAMAGSSDSRSAANRRRQTRFLRNVGMGKRRSAVRGALQRSA